MISSATACVKRFMEAFFVVRMESVLLTTVFDALVLYRNRDVFIPISVLGCGSSTGRLSARLNQRHLSFVALELWEPDVASSREHRRSYRCTGSVATSRSSARLSRAHLPFITTHMSTTPSMNDNSTILWMVSTVAAQRGGFQQSSGSS